MALQQMKVRYIGTNVGKIYFSDVERRLALGGAQEGNYHGGQDEYIIWGETKILELSGDVLSSYARGVLKYFSTNTSSTSFVNNAPLEVTIGGPWTSADEVPRVDLGDTGGTRFTDSYMQRLADDKWGPTGTAGATGYYYGNV